MNADGHLERAENIKMTIKVLEDNEEHVNSIVELVYGSAIHYIAYGCEKRFGTHLNTHAGLPKFLRNREEDEIADLFGKLDTIQHGRWYGGKGNGNTITEVLKILENIIQWSMQS